MGGNAEITKEEIHKEIDLIQGCINRMANNSFLIKGWSISLIAAFTALLINKVDIIVIALLAITIIICFWYLDSFFLKTERLFRRKYEWVIKNRCKGVRDNLYDLSPYNKDMWIDENNGKISVFEIMFSKTLLPFYGLPSLVAILTIVFNVIFRWLKLC